MDRDTKFCSYISPVTEVDVLALEAGFATSGEEEKYSNDPFEDGENY